MKENRRTLIDFLEKALEVGADSIEVEYKDHREWIYARQGHIGIGIGSLDSSAEGKLLLKEIDDLKKSKRATLGGVPYRIAVSQYEDFGEWGYRIKWNRVSAGTGATRPRPATSKRAR